MKSRYNIGNLTNKGFITGINKNYLIIDNGEIERQHQYNEVEPIKLNIDYIKALGFTDAINYHYEEKRPEKPNEKFYWGCIDWGFAIAPYFEEGKWKFGTETYDWIDEHDYILIPFVFDLQYVHELQNIMFDIFPIVDDSEWRYTFDELLNEFKNNLKLW